MKFMKNSQNYLIKEFLRKLDFIPSNSLCELAYESYSMFRVKDTSKIFKKVICRMPSSYVEIRRSAFRIIPRLIY